jgi:uncharacterized protein YkwD
MSLRPRSVASLLVPLLVALPLLALSPSTTDVPSILEAMNRERAAHGVALLRQSEALTAAAEERVRDMMERHYFDHVAPDGTSPFAAAERHGYAYTAIGENLAVGYRSAAAVVDGWMSSPGHRANLLGTQYDDVGLAIVESSPIEGYRGPLVVAMYGRR